MNDAALIADLKRAVSDLFNAREQLTAACSELEKLRADLDTARRDVAVLREALLRCANKFREYELIHAAKPDVEKARRNADMAVMVEAALAATAVRTDAAPPP